MKVAVIIPCRNEVKSIVDCIKAIFNSELSDNCTIDVFVVEGKSDDGTVEVLSDLKKTHPSLSIITNEKQLTPYAFNLGIYAGVGADYYQIIGARQIVSSNYIKNAIEVLTSDSSIWCVGGAVENVYLNEDGKIIAAAMATTFGMGLGNFRTLEKSGFTDTVGTPMYPKTVFDKIGYFDEDLVRNQDDDFNFRVIKAGGKIFFNAAISTKYFVRGNFPGLWKQFFQYGYWKVFVNRKHKAVTTFRQLIPPLFVCYLVVLPIISLFSWKIGLLASIPLLLYMMLAVLFTFKVIAKETSLPFFKVLQTFVILHMSYGLGYLRGILDFFILRKNPSDQQKELSR